MTKLYIVLGTILCLFTGYANLTGWKVLGAANAVHWGPKGMDQSAGFRHK